MSRVSLPSAASLLLACAVWTPAAWAQDELPAEAVSAEELELLRAGMSADEAARPTAAASTPVEAGLSGLGIGGARSRADANPEISLVLDAAMAWFSSEEPLQTGGHDPNKTGFTLQGLELAIEANVDPYFRFRTAIVFSQFGVEVEEAWAATQALPGSLELRAGQMLTQFGRLNNSHPHAWDFVDQPIVNGTFFGSESSRGLGLEASWLVPLPWYVLVVGSATDAAGACCARSFYGGDDLGIEGPADLLYTTALKQFFGLGDDWALMLGVSGQFGPNPTGNNNRTTIAGTDLLLRWRPRDSTRRTSVTWQSEAMLRQRQIPDDNLVDFGGYSQLVWNIAPRWATGARWEYLSGVEGDPLDPEANDDRHRTSAQVTFYPSHFSRVRIQGARDDVRWRDTVDWSAVLALEVLVGAHGAHAY